MSSSSPGIPRLTLHLATLIYPCIVFLCYYWNVQVMVGVVVALILASKIYLYLKGKVARFYQVGVTVGVAMITLGIAQVSETFALLFPAIINFSLLGVFGVSLLSPQNVIERIACSMKGDIPPEGVRHCRRACIAWCVFFFLNGCIALDSVQRDITWWSILDSMP